MAGSAGPTVHPGGSPIKSPVTGSKYLGKPAKLYQASGDPHKYNVFRRPADPVRGCGGDVQFSSAAIVEADLMPTDLTEGICKGFSYAALEYIAEHGIDNLKRALGRPFEEDGRMTEALLSFFERSCALQRQYQDVSAVVTRTNSSNVRGAVHMDIDDERWIPFRSDSVRSLQDLSDFPPGYYELRFKSDREGNEHCMGLYIGARFLQGQDFVLIDANRGLRHNTTPEAFRRDIANLFFGGPRKKAAYVHSLMHLDQLTIRRLTLNRAASSGLAGTMAY